MSQNIQSLKKLLSGIIDIDDFITVTGVSNDSRLVKPGDLFIATVGETVDARTFIPSAIEQGAAAIVYESNDGYQLKLSMSIPAFPVTHLDQWQGEIASRFYDKPSKKLWCVGVTGTNGKTSCTQWIAQALVQNKILCGVVGTLGFGFPGQLKASGYTTPDAIGLQAELAEMNSRSAKAVAIEASSHALVQHRLAGVEFDVAVFTQLSRDHLDYHRDMERYAAAKQTLFEGEHLKTAVINIDDAVGAKWADAFSKEYPVITYSLRNSKALIHTTRIDPIPEGFLVDVSTPWGKGPVQIPFLGEFNISNILAVIGVLGHFEVPFKQLLSSIEYLKPVPGRMEIFGGDGKPTVIVDYSHTPDALKNALEALRVHCEGKMWCVFGCGGDRDQGKRAEMAHIAESYSDHVIVTNDNPRTESPERIVDDIMAGFSQHKAMIEMDREKAIATAIKQAGSRDAILVAGKGHEAVQIIGERALPFSDVEHVKTILERSGETT